MSLLHGHFLMAGGTPSRHPFRKMGCSMKYSLVMTNIANWKITIFNGQIHYQWPFSIAMLVYQRVNHPASLGYPHFWKAPRTPHVRTVPLRRLQRLQWHEGCHGAQLITRLKAMEYGIRMNSRNHKE